MLGGQQGSAENAEAVQKQLEAAKDAETQLAEAREELKQVREELAELRDQGERLQESHLEEKESLKAALQAREAELAQAREAAKNLEEQLERALSRGDPDDASAARLEIEQLTQQVREADELLEQAKVDLAAEEKRRMQAEYLLNKTGVRGDPIQASTAHPGQAEPDQATPWPEDTAQSVSGAGDASPSRSEHAAGVAPQDVLQVVERGLPPLGHPETRQAEGSLHHGDGPEKTAGNPVPVAQAHQLEEGLLVEAMGGDGGGGSSSLEPSPVQSPESAAKYRVAPSLLLLPLHRPLPPAASHSPLLLSPYPPL